MVLSETTGTTTIRYWHGIDLVAQSDGTATTYLSYDGLGSVRQLTDTAGSVQLAQTFDPYGTLYSDAGTNSTKYAFTGEYQDGNGLLYLRARYYNAGSGRFTQMDPSRAESNLYWYAKSSPTMYVDPSGYCAVDSPDYERCMFAKEYIEDNYIGISIDIPDDGGCSAINPLSDEPNAWTANDLMVIQMGLDLLKNFWGSNSFKTLFTPVTIRRVQIGSASGSHMYSTDPLNPDRVKNSPVILLDNPSFSSTSYTPAGMNNTIGVLWGEMYHLMDYNLSGKPRGGVWEDPNDVLASGCGLEQIGPLWIPTGKNPITRHSFKFGYSVGWNFDQCRSALTGKGGKITISSPANLAAGGPNSNYAAGGPHDDFAHTYQVFTQALIGGQNLCASASYSLDLNGGGGGSTHRLCARSEWLSPYVRPASQLSEVMDYARLEQFIEDAKKYGAALSVTKNYSTW